MRCLWVHPAAFIRRAIAAVPTLAVPIKVCLESAIATALKRATNFLSRNAHRSPAHVRSLTVAEAFNSICDFDSPDPQTAWFDEKATRSHLEILQCKKQTKLYAQCSRPLCYPTILVTIAFPHSAL